MGMAVYALFAPTSLNSGTPTDLISRYLSGISPHTYIGLVIESDMAKSHGLEKNTEEYIVLSNMTTEIAILYQQIEDRYCKMAWNHTLQLKESDHREEKSKRLKLWKQILSAVSSAGIITVLLTSFDCGKWLELATALFTVATMVVTWLCDNGALDADVVKARNLAAECHNMRNKYESLLVDIKSGSIDVDEMRSRRSI